MPTKAELLVEQQQLIEAAAKVCRAQQAIVNSVTPSHKDCLGPSPEDREKYAKEYDRLCQELVDAVLFSVWHKETRALRALLGKLTPTGLAIDEDAPGGVRATDPETSRQSSMKLIPRSGTVRRKVYDCVLAAGERGATWHEVEQRTGVGGSWKRLAELKQGGHVVVAGTRRVPSTDSMASVYVVAPVRFS